jgi:hypothetical protein
MSPNFVERLALTGAKFRVGLSPARHPRGNAALLVNPFRLLLHESRKPQPMITIPAPIIRPQPNYRYMQPIQCGRSARG